MKREFSRIAYFIAAFALVFVVSCEQEDRYVGMTLFGDGGANLNTTYVDINAYTIAPDSLRSDRSVLANASIGAYNDPIFGKTKSSFYTQVRLSNVSPAFGDNPVLDSVVLSIPLVAFNDEDTISTEYILKNIRYDLDNGTAGCSIDDTIYKIETLRKFEVDSIYGNSDATMTLQVHRVTESMKTTDSAFYSNKTFTTSDLMGATTISNKTLQRELNDYSDPDAENIYTTISKDDNPAYHIRLDQAYSFFQTEVLDQEGSANLADQASFINNVLKGLRISVIDDDGFIFNISPSEISMVMYYQYDNPDFEDADNNGIDDDEEDCPVSEELPRIQGEYAFNMLSAYNVYFSHIENENGTINYNQTQAPRVYVEGMGGAKTIFEFDEAQIEALRDSVALNEWAITEAHFKLYPAPEQGDLPLPGYMYFYNHTQGSLLDDYGGNSTTESGFQGFPFTQISPEYDPDNGYYLLRVTEQVKNMVENNAPIDDLALEMGNYFNFSLNYYNVPKNAYYSNRVYNPYRLVLVGSNPESALEDQRIQLEIYYNKRPY